eukprot:gene17157-biopygen14763
MHSRKSLLFNDNNAWVKKDNRNFDVTMGSYDGAEVCELVGLLILNKLCNTYEQTIPDFTEMMDKPYAETPQDHKPTE